MISSESKKVLDFMELNVILGTEFEYYSQFYAYAKNDYSMSVKSLMSNFSFVEIANIIRIAKETDNLWILVNMNHPVTVEGKQYSTKRKFLRSLNLTQRDFLKRILKYKGDLEKSLQPKSKGVTFLGKDYEDFVKLFSEFNSEVPVLGEMPVPFKTLEDYIGYLESSYVMIDAKPLISLRQLCIHVKSTSQLLVPIFKYYKKTGTLLERQESFDELLERFYQAQEQFKKDSGSITHGSLTEFANLYNRTPQSIIKTIFSPQPFNVVQMSLQFGDSYGIQLNNYSRKLIFKGTENDFDDISNILGLTNNQLNDILISGFSNSFVEQRLMEIAWKKGLYDFEVKVVNFEETNPFLDSLFKL